MSSSQNPILLFYDGYELKAREKPSERLFHEARCSLRAAYRSLQGKQVNTGFYEAFRSIVKGLKKLGYDVRINDFRAARENPDYPIGLAGFPSVIDEVALPNPTIFGPGDPGYPDVAGEYAQRENVKFIIQPCDWFVDYYRPYCGDKMIRCPVGIDFEHICDASEQKKQNDFLIYDKIRWSRDRVVPAVLDKLTNELDGRGLSYEIVRYGDHTQTQYFDALSRSKAMAFVCEHETQGIACEEALAMNVPVFAWEEQVLCDPKQQPFAQEGLKVSTVPYFDHSCGKTFTIKSMKERLDDFLADSSAYAPRQFVKENLSLEACSQRFANAYFKLVEA